MQANNPTEEDIEYVNSSIIDDKEDREVIKKMLKWQNHIQMKKYKLLNTSMIIKQKQKLKEKSILYHENTYIQNSGMDFGLTDTFDVVAVLDGTVVDVREDELLGTVVEIKHDNDFISSYQSLSEYQLRKMIQLNKDKVIGKSGYKYN